MLMDHRKDFNVGAVDYRKYLFYRVAFPETSPGKLSTVKVASFILILVVVIVGCLLSLTQSRDIRQFLENLKGVMLEVMVLSVAVNESVISRRKVERIFQYISQRRANTRLFERPLYELSLPSLIEYVLEFLILFNPMQCFVNFIAFYKIYGLPEENEIVNKACASAMKTIRLYSVLFAANFPLMMLTKPAMKAISGYSWKQLPYPWTIPEGDDLIFYGSLLLQTVGLFLSHLLGILGISVLTITTQFTAQFDIVLLGIQRIEERAARKMSQDGLTYHESMLSCLKESIAHHQELVEELLMGKAHLENTFFFLIMAISIIMACEAYPLIKEDLALSDAIKGVWFLIVQVACTAVMCNDMEVMSNKNVEMRDALYGTNWSNCDTQYRRILLNGMTFCQNPISIHGKGLFNMKASRATFYSAMVSTYNLLNMIRKIQ